MLNWYFELDSDGDVSVKPDSGVYIWHMVRKMASYMERFKKRNQKMKQMYRSVQKYSKT